MFYITTSIIVAENPVAMAAYLRRRFSNSTVKKYKNKRVWIGIDGEQEGQELLNWIKSLPPYDGKYDNVV